MDGNIRLTDHDTVIGVFRSFLYVISFPVLWCFVKKIKNNNNK